MHLRKVGLLLQVTESQISLAMYKEFLKLSCFLSEVCIRNRSDGITLFANATEERYLIHFE